MRVQKIIIRSLFALLGLVCMMTLKAQKVPSKLMSIPVYHPMVMNPAFVGSKDFTNISLTSKVFKTPNSQIINYHKRRTGSNGIFSKIGIGAYGFQEQGNESWNTGVTVAGSYHLALDKANVHNLAVGTSLKGFLNIPKNSEVTSDDTISSAFNPNLDFGIYYYGPTAFVGLSVTSIFGTNLSDEITIDSDAYIPREYHFYGGYKFLLSKSNSIVLEPSLLVSLNDSTISEPHKHLVPYLKVYLQNFYIGTYVKSLDIFALFFQYQFPRFYTGLFLEFPRVGFLNNDNIIFELNLGVNLGQGGDKFLQYRHW
ncbi:MAG: type IX secretion system membrane protein PorP/SprF [Bacteroidota bacterium]